MCNLFDDVVDGVCLVRRGVDVRPGVGGDSRRCAKAGWHQTCALGR